MERIKKSIKIVEKLQSLYCKVDDCNRGEVNIQHSNQLIGPQSHVLVAWQGVSNNNRRNNQVGNIFAN